MIQITASLVKELRGKSGAGMMDCKNALKENDGDVETAMDWLRQKGIAKAAKKSGRVAAEGLVAVASNGLSSVAVEVNAETDFVARNEAFQEIVRTIAAVGLEKNGDLAATLAADYPDTGRNIQDQLTEFVGAIGENMTLRRLQGLAVEQGVVATYVHNSVIPGMGKIAVLVALDSTADEAMLTALGKQLAMHVAATAPLALSTDDLDGQAVERERNILIEQARSSGKPDNIIEKMIAGRMAKYYQEVVLMEQTFIIDGETKITKVIDNAARDVGADIRLAGYVRLELGAGIDKAEDDFAAEVAAVAGR